MDAELKADAVEECLTCCRASVKPLNCIPEYTLMLREGRGWTADDAEEVGWAALQVVRVTVRESGG